VLEVVFRRATLENLRGIVELLASDPSGSHREDATSGIETVGVRQDDRSQGLAELVRLRPDGSVVERHRVTTVSNETEADPILGGAFIGDYIQVDAVRGTAYVAYNANLKHERLLGQGVPIPQQDNYLVRVRE
jgi:hypothetical protein